MFAVQTSPLTFVKCTHSRALNRTDVHEYVSIAPLLGTAKRSDAKRDAGTDDQINEPFGEIDLH